MKSNYPVHLRKNDKPRTSLNIKGFHPDCDLKFEDWLIIEDYKRYREKNE